MLATVFAGILSAIGQAQVNVTTYHNDNARTAQNLQETILAPSNVNSAQFGKLFSVPVDGWIYAQPLYLSGVNISGGTHNVLYVATEHDSLYAIDADTGTIYWQISLIPSGGSTVNSSADLGCGDLVPEIGITGTPVIDTSTGTIYLVAKSKVGGNIVQYIHAIDVVTSLEKFNGPVAIQASVPGSASDGNGTMVSFNPRLENQRVGLLLDNGHVMIGWSSHCDINPWHGWIMSYSAANLTQQPEAAFNTTPNGSEGGTWMSGGGLAADASGNIYFATGNGSWNGTSDFSDSILKLGLPSAGSFPIVDYFTPFNQGALSGGDTDVASGGVMLLPTLPSGQQLLVQMGKEGKMYLLDRNNMGKYCPNLTPPCSGNDPQIVQEIPGATVGIWGTPAYWNGSIYWGGADDGASADNLKAFSFNANNSGLISASPTSSSAKAFSFAAPSPSISANGSSNGILWGLDDSPFGNCSSMSNCQVLYAYDATNLGNMLYNSNQAAGNRDVPGKMVKFATPTIANGKVYVGTETQVTAFGLLSTKPTTATPTFSPAPGSYIAAQSVTLSDTTPAAVIYYTVDGSTPTTSSPVFSTPILVSVTTTIKTMAAASGFNNSAIATGIYTITGPTTATPTFSPGPGTYSSAQSVTLSDTTPGAVIYYTTDGSTPTTASTVFSTPIPVSVTTTIKAMAAATGFNNSVVATGAYTITLATTATPTFSPAPGSYTSAQSVMLSDTTPGAVIYYTTDGSTPTTSSPVFSTPIPVSVTTTIRALATAPGFTNSAIANGTYTIGSGSGGVAFVRNSTVANVTAGTGTGSIAMAFPANTAAGDLIVVTVAVAGGALSMTVSDPINGNYTSAGTVTNSVGNESAVFYAANAASITSSQNITFSWTGGVSGGLFITAGATEFSGAATTGVLNGETSNVSNTGSLSMSTGSLTPTVANCLFVALSNNDNGSTETLTSSGWKAIWNIAGSGAGGQADYIIGANVSAQQATWTMAGNAFPWVAEIIAFIPSQSTVTATPTLNPASGTYGSVQSVTLSDTTPGAVIYYTTDGNTPTTSSPVFSIPIPVNVTTTIKAMAAAPGFSNSAVATGTYTLTTATPTLSPAPGPYTSAQSVTLSDTTSGAVIYYTTDGSTPTTASPVFNTPIPVNATTTIKTMAAATGFNNSAVASGIYTITLPTTATPTLNPASGTYSSVQSVALSDTTTGAVIYYTTDGSTPTTSSPVYSTQIPVNVTTTIQAMAAAPGFINSAVATGTYTLTTATPTFSPAPGSYTSAQSVTLSDTTTGAVIYYTTDGSTPTTSSPVFSISIPVSATTTIKTMAAATGFNNSAVAIGAYTITLPTAATPTFNPAPGTYSSVQSVTLSDTTPGAVIYYTTDGSTPTTSSPVFSIPIPVNVTTTIRAMAAAPGFVNSAVTTGTYTLTTATPTFSPAPGTYASVQSVTLSDTTPGAVIYYTTDGSTPTTASPVFSTPILVSVTTTIRAMAGAPGFNNSAVANGTYTIGSGSGGVTFVRNSTVGNVGAGKGTGSITMAFPANTAAGDLIVVTVAVAGGGLAMTVSDPINGNYTSAGTVTNSVGNESAIFYAANTASISSSQNITLSWSGGRVVYITAGATEFSGAATIGVLNNETSNFSSVAGSSLSTGSLTPTVANCLFIAISDNNNGSTETLKTSGWKSIWNIAGSGAGGQADYIIGTGLNAQQATWTIAGKPFPWAAEIAAFAPHP